MTLEDAIAQARVTHEQRLASGFNQVALDEAARLGFANAAFEEDDEEVPAILEEFYNDSAGDANQDVSTGSTNPAALPRQGQEVAQTGTPTLAAKLQRKANDAIEASPQPRQIAPDD